MTVITQRQFLERVREGQAVFIFDQKVYRVDRFLDKHPGGRLAIWHMIGRDATAEIRVMHPDWVITRKMPCYCLGDYRPDDLSSDTVYDSDEAVQGLAVKEEEEEEEEEEKEEKEEEDKEATTPLATEKGAEAEEEAHADIDYEAIERDFYLLQRQVTDLGLERTPFRRYAEEWGRYSLFLAGMIGLGLWGPQHWLNYTLALFAHDLGHNGVTHDLFWDGFMGVMIADFIGGLSIGWWKKNHNVHHIVTNDPEHDPDIQHLPFFAVSTKFFRNLRSSYYGRKLPFDAFAAVLIPLQHLLYLPILCFGRFNLYFLSLSHLFTAEFAPWRWLELTGIAFFWTWYLTFLSSFPTWQWALYHMVLAHMGTVILHLQITLSHFGMSTTCPDPDRECFAARQLRTTMDIDCPTWFDWFHGGLQYQVEHHLFPRLPRHNLRQVQPLVKEFVARHPGLRFYSFNFIEANQLMLESLKSVGEQLLFISIVLRSPAE
ncbi:fatty acid desaturase-domain-containing protein [Dimargaris cristalligena]|uniref:Fatty acid desaturase-domain-containing protein n=1 Tax=Dimargaris cristalligena TaxID=215637 RepID=A0A4P9ZM65_9FUNG|nr:fatty acid desaturase-domain-containing protein [Dimargaris cristalligena]|eukprot:RKP34404.1 fatty acid desaturase-domain-containing protein [Dimargaris cristalligena]